MQSILKEGDPMKKLSVFVIALAVAALGACSSMSSGSGWTVLFDGSSLDNWNAIGNANWRIADGSVMADSGDKRQGFLVSKNSYTDFQVRAEFWVEDDAETGVFISCDARTQVEEDNAYARVGELTVCF